MIVLAIFGTIAAIGWTLAVMFANGMRSSPGEFEGRPSIIAAWAGSAILWLAWGFN